MSKTATPQHYTITVPFANLVQSSILGPLFQGVQSRVYGAISGHINAPLGNNYTQAMAFTAAGINYTISNINSGNDQYVNVYNVTFVNKSNGVDIVVKGHIALFKEVDKNMMFCVARASAVGSIDWSCTLSIQTQNGPGGNPILGISQTTKIDNATNNQVLNACAKVWQFMGTIIQGTINAINNINQPLFNDVLGSVARGAGKQLANITQAFQVTPAAPQGTVLIPQVASIDNNGNFQLTLVSK